MPDARRVVVLEADTVNRFSTERILRREDYWLFVTEDPAAAVRVASVSAIDLVLVDLALGRLEAVPPSQRRRGDAIFRGVPSSLTDGYAVLRPLHLDPASARFPVVTLKTDDLPVEPPPLCRFAVVQFLPRPWKAGGLVEGLNAIFRDTAWGPAKPEADDEAGARVVWARDGRASSPPFGSTPAALRNALVVDPDEEERRAVVQDLVQHGFSVLEATTGEQALCLAVARRPWLVLTELILADQSGLALCRKIRQHSLLRRTPVVFLSARDDCDTRYQALKAGADDFLAKPAPSRELRIRLELLLRRFAEIELGTEPGAGLRGAVELVGAPAVLQICHVNGLTGVLVARRGSQSIRIAFRHGQVVSATGPDHEGPLVVYDFIAWPHGQFEFDRGALVEGTPMEADFNALLLEGCRRLDERRRGRPAEPVLH
ncbi:MAG TPA: response regulator [Vicinamibacteria bacterium]|nr:response regulator [Vicinamibacteria bacterium]